MGIDLAKIRAKIAQLNGEGKTQGSANTQIWKPKAGEYTVRCLHWPEGMCRDGEYCIERYFYYIPDQVLAPEQFQKPDPVREFQRKLFSTKDPSDKEIAKKLFPKMYCFLPVVVLEGEDADPNKVVIWKFGSNIYQKLLGYFMNAKIGDYFDLDEGFNIKVNVEQFKNSAFTKEVELDAFSKGPLENGEKLSKNIPSISNVWPERSYEELTKKLDDWLNGNTSSNQSNGTEKSQDSVKVEKKEAITKSAKSDLDALDELIDATKKGDEVVERKKSPVAKKATPTKKDESVSEKTYQDLDDAFADLVNDEE